MSLRERLSRLSRGNGILPVATLIGFVENTFILAPMEPLYMPLMAARRPQIWAIATALLVGNILGGLFMYWLGAAFLDEAIKPLIEWMGAQDKYDQALEELKGNGFLWLFVIGITPFPFQIGVAAAGVVGYPILPFIIAVGVSRSIRYFAEAALVYAVGEKADDLLKRYRVHLYVGGIAIFLIMFGWVIFS